MSEKTAAPKLLVPITKKLINVFKRGDWRMGLKPCYQTKTAPCQANCPAGNDIRGWLALLKNGRVKEAAELIQKTSPFPGVCGFVCPRLCEANCNRRDFDEAVAVNRLENKLGLLRLALLENQELELSRASKTQSSKIAVIGSGPAGLSCAWQMLRAGYRVTIFEKESQPGGMLTQAIPEFRLPRKWAEAEINLILKSGAELKTGAAIGKNITLDQLQAEYDAVFIATGAHKSRKLNIPGEAESDGIVYGLNFLKNIEIFRPIFGKEIWRVVVVGGGNTAIDAARSAKKFGVDFVTVVYRRNEEEMPAQKSEVEEVKKEGVEFVFLAAPEMIRAGTPIKELTLRKMTIGEPDESGRKKPMPTNERLLIGANLIIPAIGEESDLDEIIGAFSEKSAEEKQAAIEMMESQGIFVGGDCLTGPSYVAQAIGQGRQAAEKIAAYLEGRDYEKPASPPVVLAENLNLAYFAPEHRCEEKDFFNFIRKETGRCLSCGLCPQDPAICKNCWQFCPDAAVEFKDGKFHINLDYCKGCLICSQECPRRVVNIEEEKK
jgi:formate dehydrogenase major subunit